MTVVHICKYYDDSKVHRNLINGFSSHHRGETKVLVGSHEQTKGGGDGVYYCTYSRILRFFLLTRTLWVFWFSLRKSIFSDAKLIFCHTLVVDGLLGYLAHKFFGIPYVLQVRNTDVNFYYKKFPLYRPIFNLILKNCSAVGFVSKANMNSFYSIKGLALKVKKSYLWPNGIDDFWLSFDNDRLSERKEICSRNGFVFVGRFNENKNIRNIVSAHKAILSHGYDIPITYIGGNEEEFYLSTGSKASDLKYTTLIENMNMDSLSEIYSSSICLVVPSYFETFGLVYLESLSRCCPIICSEGQGIHSLFPECKSIRFVQPSSIASIEKSMLFFVENTLQNEDFPSIECFSWKALTKNIFQDLKGLL